jgi:hypothetical protein
MFLIEKPADILNLDYLEDKNMGSFKSTYLDDYMNANINGIVPIVFKSS